jgi:hypothetical protein
MIYAITMGLIVLFYWITVDKGNNFILIIV